MDKVLEKIREQRVRKMYTVDLNCDLGESFGNYKCGMDEEIIPYISSANTACGFHASDPLVMEQTVKLAKNYGVHIGAHPGYPDLTGFGRRNIQVSEEELKAMVQYQIGALKAFCDAFGVPLYHVKPHGAMYNMAVTHTGLAEAICRGIREVDQNLILLAPAGSEMFRAAKKFGLRAAGEVFADRAYEEDGTLVPRRKEGAVITEEEVAIERVVGMVKKGTVTAVTGKEIEVQADSICVHGDGPKALAFVKRIRETLTEEGVKICPLSEIV